LIVKFDDNTKKERQDERKICKRKKTN